ncbi:hypothetical protein JCM10207_004313 [Rhodosporidiobolus poonsookiae]
MTASARVHPDAVPTLVLIKVVALAVSSPSVLPHLDNLAQLALDAVYSTQPPASLQEWTTRAHGADPPGSLRDTVQGIVVGVKLSGLDQATSWLSAEFKPLIAWSEEDELALSTFPLVRASPFGLYLRRTLLRFGKMSFADMTEWWEAFCAWCDGRVGEGEGGKGAAEKFAQARLRQDHHASRELVRALSTSDGSSLGTNERSPQEALLHLALVEYEDGGYDVAEQALEEATRIARTVGDVACLAACSSLQLRLSASQVRPQSREATASANANTPSDVLFSISRSVSSGAPLPAPLLKLSHALALSQHYAFPPASSSSSSAQPHLPPLASQKKDDAPRPGDGRWAAMGEAVRGQVWADLGVAPLASTHDALALEFQDAHQPDWDVQLSVLSRRAQRLAQANRPDAALELLLEAVESPEKRRGVGVKELREWKGAVEAVEKERRARGRLTGPVPSSPAYLASADLPLPTLLSLTLKSHQSSTHSLRRLPRLSALLSLSDLRVSLSGARGERGLDAARRGLREVEEAWGEVVSLEAGAGGDEEGEGAEVVARAWEVRGRLEVVAAQGEDARLPVAIEHLEQALAGYRLLSLLPASHRVLRLLTHLASHLAQSTSLPGGAVRHWTAQREKWAAEWVELDDARRAEEAGEEERERRVREIVEAVERVVEAEVGL